MNRLFENNFYRLLLLWATLAAVVAYAWIGSKMMAPKFMLPSSVASLVVLENGKGKTIDDALDGHAFLLMRGMKELERFDSAIHLIGGLPNPVDFVISFDEPDRYLITESTVEIGAKLIEFDGQIAKAFTKAWLFQRSRADLKGSLLRIEVVSDLLWAMLNGRLNLEVPARDQELAFPKVAPWLLFATPFRSHCDSVWNSMELRQLCAIRKSGESEASDSIHATSFRPLLGGMVWDIYQGLSIMGRIDFLRAWVSWIIAGASSEELQRPEAIGQWRSWLRSEFERILPPHLLAKAGLSEPSDYNEIVDTALERAALADRKGFDVDFLFRSNRATSEDVQVLASVFAIGNEKLWKTKAVALVETPEGIFTLPGFARLEEATEEGIRSRHLVWEACEAPTVQDIINDQVRSQRILYVKACKESLRSTYSPLVSMGVQGFAAANPGATFVLLRKPSVELAVSKNLFGKGSVLNDLLSRSKSLEDLSPQLGFREARWNPDIQAFRVLGAVEAVEWYRSESKDHTSSN